MVWALENRWLRDWRVNGRSFITIYFSHNTSHTTYYGSLHLFLRRLTVEWKIQARSVSVRAHLSKRIKPIEEWTDAEKREIGLVR